MTQAGVIVLGYDGSDGADAALAEVIARARLIAVGSRGTGPVLGSILGSVTYKLVHRSTIPVLVCPVRG